MMRRTAAVLAVLILSAVVTAFGSQTLPVLRNVSVATGLPDPSDTRPVSDDYIIEVAGNGAGFFDFDNDGDPDLAIAHGSTIARYAGGGDPVVRLYRNDDGQWSDVSAGAGLVARGWGMGVCIADYDNDGHQDLYVTGYGPNVHYRNNGDGTFSDVTPESGTGNPGWSTGCAFADYDRDGHLDLYVANYVAFDAQSAPRAGEGEQCRFMGIDVFCGPRGLEGQPDALYRNNGDGSFSDVTTAAGIVDPNAYGFGVVFTDLDDDGWADVYVANDSVANLLFRNQTDGTFEEVALPSGAALSEQGRAQAGMGVATGDFDANGIPDIMVTNFSHDRNTLYQNLGDLLFIDASSQAGLGEVSLPYLGWGVAFADLDNDSFEDLLIANGHIYTEMDTVDVGTRFRQPREVYRNRGDGTFEFMADRFGVDLMEPRSARGLALGDWDGDGDLDAVTTNLESGPDLYRNDGGNGNHWIRLHLIGVESNRDAVGAKVEVAFGDRTRTRVVQSGGSYMSHHEMPLHFGLGSATEVDSVRIWWPSGRVEELEGLAADQLLTIQEGSGIVTP